MAENARSSTLYIVTESTAGTPVDVSSAAEALPLQPGFAANPQIQEIVSEEIRASIGASASIPGIEEPVFNDSQYLRGSGTQGTAPRIGKIFESCLGTAASAQATERTLAAASTTTVLKLAAGGGDYGTGKTTAVLIKDGTNGYNIRPIYSVSTNDLTMLFSVPTAPAISVTLGKYVSYVPANSGHQTRTIHLFRGAGGSHEAIAGALVESLNINVNTGDLINMDVNWRGTAFYFDPIRISASNNKLDFTDDDGTFAATIPSALYRTPQELASAIATAMDTANSGETHSCAYYSYGSNKGKFRIYSTGTVLSLLWNTGANTANGIHTTIGYSSAADDSGTAATTGYYSDNVQTYTSGVTPSYDSTDPMVAKYMEVLVGDQTDYESVCVIDMSINISNTITTSECISAVSGVDSVFASGRVVEIQITAQFARHDADKFNRFLNNSDVRFCANLGPKSGGNWVPGKCFSFFTHSAKISAVSLDTGDGDIVTQVYSIKPYVDSSGNAEFYINQL